MSLPSFIRAANPEATERPQQEPGNNCIQSFLFMTILYRMGGVIRHVSISCPLLDPLLELHCLMSAVGI